MKSVASLQEAALAAQRAADYVTLRHVSDDLVALAGSSGDTTALAWGEFFAGVALVNSNDGNGAERALRRALQLFEEIGDRFAAARAMMNLGTIEVDIHLNSGAARRLYELAEPIIREMNDPMRLAIALGNLSEIYRLEGDYRRAMATGNESLQLFADIDDPARAAWQLANIALCQSLLRDVAAAFDSMSAAYDLIVRDPNPRWLAWHFDVWFIIAAKLQRWETAARLLGFVDRLRHEKNVPRLPGLLPWFSLPVESLGRALTDERLHDLMLEGEALSVADAQALGADLAAGL